MKTTTCVKDPETSLGIFPRWGFTLIELLVVVLIIGILAAIALPQYQKAVLKSRFSSLMPTAQAIRDGNEMYYMTNGGYADALNKLDVTTANTEDMTITLSDDEDYAYTMATRPNIKNNLIMYQKHSINFPSEIHCEAESGNAHAEWLCATALKGTSISGSISGGNYKTYVLNGKGTDTFSNSSSGASALALAAFLNTSYCTTDEFTCSVDVENELVRRCNQWDACEEYTLSLDQNANPVYRRCAYGENNGACAIGEEEYETIINSEGQKQSKACHGFSSETQRCEQHDTDWSTYDDSGNLTSFEHHDCLDCLGENYTYVEKYALSYDAEGNSLGITGYQVNCGESSNCLGNTAGNVGMQIDYTFDDGNGDGQQITVQCNDGENGACTLWSVNNYTTGDSYTCARWNIEGRYCEEVSD